ncbi:hypothetical protein EDF81_0197 [Enterobacter sp. BIGb0383]|nr:hypothetical protein EDF81_0197 [Enterobacter sp. BIGb0383]ROS11884.1 hypothetical protein EC848_0197 [Enterobacter sp. BIGb0359]
MSERYIYHFLYSLQGAALSIKIEWKRLFITQNIAISLMSALNEELTLFSLG